MSWFRRKPKVPPEAERISRRAAAAKEYVDQAVTRTQSRQRAVSESSGWLEWRRAENHLTPLLFPDRRR